MGLVPWCGGETWQTEPFDAKPRRLTPAREDHGQAGVSFSDLVGPADVGVVERGRGERLTA